MEAFLKFTVKFNEAWLCMRKAWRVRILNIRVSLSSGTGKYQIPDPRPSRAYVPILNLGLGTVLS